MREGGVLSTSHYFPLGIAASCELRFKLLPIDELQLDQLLFELYLATRHSFTSDTQVLRVTPQVISLQERKLVPIRTITHETKKTLP